MSIVACVSCGKYGNSAFTTIHVIDGEVVRLCLQCWREIEGITEALNEAERGTITLHELKLRLGRQP